MDSMDSFTFGYWVRRQRMALDLTQAALARRVGCAKVTVNKIERDERRPSRTMAERLAESLEIPEKDRETIILCGLGEVPLSRLPPPAGSISPGSHRQRIGYPVQESPDVRTDETPLYWTVAPQPSHNLPLQLTSFIGREREIEAARELLAANRLVTLTGHGGAGKTRLALQVAFDSLENYLDGVYLVELASLADPDLVPHTVARALGLPETAGKTHTETVEDYLRDRSLLLVLDNCEHLVETCAHLVVRFLGACPDLTILSTSREILGVKGEAVYLVPPLAVPETAEPPIPQDLVRYDAVKLFEERARLIVPDFEITVTNAASLMEIVTRLDGIPLAIELAAARLRVLSVAGIAQHLDDAFRLLAGGSRTDLPRHQALRSSIDWSYDLLDEREKVLLRRLSVFASGWTLEAAEKVCAGKEDSDQNPADILDLLNGLVDKSFINTTREAGGVKRFHMLEIVRQYTGEKLANEKLDEVGELQSMRDRHLAHYLELAEDCAPELRGRRQVQVFSHLSGEMDNLRLALSWAFERKQTLTMLRLVSALLRFWIVGRHFTEGCRWAREALSLSGGADFNRSPRRAWVMVSLGTLLVTAKENFAEARSTLKEAETIFRENRDQSGTAHSLYVRGLAAYEHNKSEEPKLLLRESLALARAVGDRWLVRKCLFWLGRIAGHAGDHRKWMTLSEEAVTVLRESGDPLEIDDPIHEFATISYLRGDTARARQIVEYVMAEFHQPDEGQAVYITHYLFGLLAARMGEFKLARSIAQDHLAVAREWNRKLDMAYALLLSGMVNHLGNDLEMARLQLEESARIFKGSYVQYMVSWVYEILGQVFVSQGLVDQGVALLEESLAMEEKSWQDGYANKTLALGNALRAQGDLDQAAAYCRESMDIHYKIGFLAHIPAKLEALAKIAILQDQSERVARLFGAAQAWRQRFETPVLPVEQDEYDVCLASLRQSLGEARFEQLLAEGRAMSIEEAVAYALE